ncbi:MAG: HEAT repeat domain-containing protein, partial [Planctomycetaceae bacterium]|nr:HEAT repeat domain-containing protein [Planctomycetaceae bacterium]
MIELRWGVSELIAQRRFWLLLAIPVLGGIIFFVVAGGDSGDRIDSLRKSANIPALEEIVKTAPPAEARRALMAIGQVGGERAVQPLRNAVKSNVPEVR